MKALAIAGTELRRLVRWRANVFFLFILPVVIILLLGAAFGSESAGIGVVGGDGRLAARFTAVLERKPNLEVDRFDDEDALREAVERGRVTAGVVIPAAFDRRLGGGEAATLRYIARPSDLGQHFRAAVESAAAEVDAVVRGARVVEGRGVAPAEALAISERASQRVRPVAVRVVDPDGKPYPTSVGRFDEAASTQLLLFIFLTSLNGAIWLIETRDLGILRRMLSTPTSGRTVLAGEALGRLAVAVLQAVLIMAGALVLFGVDWGDPLAALALALAFCLVGTGAGMLLGATAGSAQQAGPLAILLGLVLAAFGGCMVPLEVFPDRIRAVAHVTPHAWAIEGFTELTRHGGTLSDVIVQVAVLLGFAAVLLTLATWRLRAVVVR